MMSHRPSFVQTKVASLVVHFVRRNPSDVGNVLLIVEASCLNILYPWNFYISGRAIYRCFPYIHLTPLTVQRNVLNMKAMDVYFPQFITQDSNLSFYAKHVETLVINSVQCLFIIQRPKLLEALKKSVRVLHIHQACNRFYIYMRKLMVHMQYFGKLREIVMFNMTLDEAHLDEILHLWAGHGEGAAEGVVKEVLPGMDDEEKESEDESTEVMYSRKPSSDQKSDAVGSKVNNQEVKNDVSSSFLKEKKCSKDDINTSDVSQSGSNDDVDNDAGGGGKRNENKCMAVAASSSGQIDGEGDTYKSTSDNLDSDDEPSIDYEEDDFEEDYGHDYGNAFPIGFHSGSEDELFDSGDYDEQHEDLMDFIFGPAGMDNQFNIDVDVLERPPTNTAKPQDPRFYDRGSDSNIVSTFLIRLG